jgi:hypothetical protein
MIKLKKLLKESTWVNRKFGEPLPTMADYKKAHNEGKLTEKAKRDYKAEYKKYGSSTKSKKYRAELNAYNRKKGTYGNGDGLDASHRNGKIVGFEEQSKNRGRAEKSRLKKEGKINKGKVDKSYYRVIAFVRKESKKLNDDDLYAMTQKLAKWFK